MDLVALDRSVALAAKEGQDLERMREVSGKRAFDALFAWESSAHERDHKDALLRWIAHLTIVRVAQPAKERVRAALEAETPVRLDADEKLSFRAAQKRLLASRARAESQELVRAMSEMGPELLAAHALYEEVCVEARRRFGEPLVALDLTARDAAASFAQDILAKTHDLARDVVSDEHPICADILLAREHGDGLPAQTVRFASDLFAERFDDLPIALPPPPPPLGAVSFARALAEFGVALRAAAPPPHPFALRRAPHDALAHLLAATFGALFLLPEFHRHALGLGTDRANKAARAHALAALLMVRIDAARRRPRDMLEQTAFEVFGHPLPAPFLSAWLRTRDDEDERTTATASTLFLLEDLRDRFDSDWFRNPRALAHLHARAAEPPTKMSIPDDAAMRLARRFEEVLG